MQTPSEVGRIGIIGTGVIGAGWTARFLYYGYDVVAWDPAPKAEEKLRSAVNNAWPDLEKLLPKPQSARGTLTFAPDLNGACQAVDFIQESAPEREELKCKLLAEIDHCSSPDIVIASSSSGLLPSAIQNECVHAERVIVGHPFNPVYLLPLVEVVPGANTSNHTLKSAMAFYRACGMHPLHVRKEIEGYLSDRLQEAVWREILHLVNDGFATTGELDDAITLGPGLRWAFMGTCLTFHLAGGNEGMRHMLEQFGPALKLPWTKLEAPELTDSLITQMVEGTSSQAGNQTISELEQLRDNCLVSIMQALQEYDIGAGRILNRQTPSQ